MRGSYLFNRKISALLALENPRSNNSISGRLIVIAVLGEIGDELSRQGTVAYAHVQQSLSYIAFWF
jgi:hypothetical protein